MTESRPPAGRPPPLWLDAGLRIGQAQRRFRLTVGGMLAALVIVAMVGGWAYVQVRGSLRDLRSSGMVSLLEAESRALQLWIEEKKRDGERWASSPRVQGPGAALAAAAVGGIACFPPPQRAIRDEIAPFTAVEEVAIFNLITRDGRIVSTPHAEYCGARVAPDFLERLAPVFEGKTVFVRPWREEERVAGAHPSAAGAAALTWIETPVRGASGDVVAALGFGRVASQRFSRLLALTSGGTTREAYAFDETGILVTDSRYAAELPPPGPRGRRVNVPGGGPTALAAAALAHHDGTQGVLLEPYRNYRGAEVIGAWRWLPEERIAVAVEVDASEAYGALDYLQLAFGVLFALVLLAMAAAASTSLWAVRVGMREARRIGPYDIESEIGEGGMSRVYRARHGQLKRLAAVKVLKPHLATEEAVARFRREAQRCSLLTHPNTVEVHDYGITGDGGWYYAMELLRGISIEALVRRQGALPVARVIHALRQACGSLEEAHGMGLVHRDVKPGNLMLCVSGGLHDVLKVLDFGLVKDLDSAPTRDLTRHSRILGTPLYMSPEQLRDPAQADGRADIYGLGAVAWFALAGRSPFDAQTDHDIVYRVYNEPAPDLAQAADVPPELAALVARCLAKERSQRPASAAELRVALADLALRWPWTEAEARAWWQANAAPLGIA